MIVRGYTPDDYSQVAALYKQPGLYGGQFDEARDAPDRLEAKIKQDPLSILVAEHESRIVGTVSLIEDARVAWLFRFAVENSGNSQAITTVLQARAENILRGRGHQQVLVYPAAGDASLDARYLAAGLRKGQDYTCFWKPL